jgi:aspartyl-tRNA(Asn)/glutamyl-tRNA(Gln) amidotransferase subunit C
MPVTLTREQVEHVAMLGRLALSDEELERTRNELGRILGYFEELQQLDTEGVPPTSHAIPMVNVFREDEVGESMPREEILRAAPDRTEEYFRVPRIVED